MSEVADALALGDTEAATLAALRLAARELALPAGWPPSWAVFAGVYAAGAHRQWAAGGGDEPADRMPYIREELHGDALGIAVEAELGRVGCYAVERWVMAEWRAIVDHANALYRAEGSIAAGAQA